MIGIVIVTHGKLGQAMLQTAEMIVGHQRNVHAVALDPDTNLDWLQGEIEKVVRLSDEGQGVLIMVDLFGGTPANAAAASMRWPQYECLCGVNLPMLLEALLAREQVPLHELSARIESMACQSIVNLKAVLQRGMPGTGAVQANS
jgi:PTS system mannose-specific IIA component